MIHPELYAWNVDWDKWCERFIYPATKDKSFRLVVRDMGSEVYQWQLFTEEFCRMMIEEVEHQNLWTKDRHDNYPTTDVLLSTLGLDDMYNKVLDEFCHPFARRLWGLEGRGWKSVGSENFMARYSEDTQTYLAVHHDSSDYTFTLGLNTDFEGGGTWFPNQKILANPKGGTISLFPNITHPHGGMPTTKGKRYIIVSFVERKTDDWGTPR
tara:strand:+ start:1472 stop:2104 length:633 start_codon:yes stop_codon:yes gene_type:complete